MPLILYQNRCAGIRLETSGNNRQLGHQGEAAVRAIGRSKGGLARDVQIQQVQGSLHPRKSP